MKTKLLDMQLKVASLEQARWKRTARELREKLFMFAERTEFSDDTTRAQSMYFENLSYEIFESNEDFITERFLEWYLLDYVTSCGQTLTDIFIKRKKHQLSKWELKLLNDWKKSRASLYEVVDIGFRGEAVVKDLLRGGSYHVNSGKATESLEKNSVVFMRIIAVGERYEFSTNGFSLPLYVKSHLVDLIKKDFKCLKSIIDSERYCWDDYLKEKAHVINNLVVELGLISNLPNLLTFEGHELVESRAVYEIKNYSAFLKTIEKSPYYTLTKEHKGNRGSNGTVYNWLDSRTNKHVLGNIIVNSDSMVLKCISKERLKRGKRVINSLFRGLVSHKKDYYTNIKAKMFKMMLNNLNLSELESVEKNRLKSSKKVLQGFIERANEYNWANCGYVDAATKAMMELYERGYNDKQIDCALYLWHEYCSKEKPVIRKPNVWAAVIVYTIARLEFDSNVLQKDLAEKFGVSASIISLRFKDLCRVLKLDIFEQYLIKHVFSTKELENIKDLLRNIFNDLRI